MLKKLHKLTENIYETPRSINVDGMKVGRDALKVEFKYACIEEMFPLSDLCT